MSDEQFLHATKNGDVTILQLSGIVNDRALVIEFTEQLLRYVDEKKPLKLQLDFVNILAFSSEAINALLRANKRISERNGRMVLCRLNADIRHLMKLVGLDGTVLEIHDSRYEATQALTRYST